MTEGADIRSLGTAAAQKKVRRAGLVQKLQLQNGNVPGLPGNFLSLPGQLIELLSADLHRGIHGRDLLLRTQKAAERRRDILSGDLDG